MYMTDFAYDGPIFLVPLSSSYPSSPVQPAQPWSEGERLINGTFKKESLDFFILVAKTLLLNLEARSEQRFDVKEL